MTSFALYGPAHRRSLRPRNRLSPGRSRAVRDDGDEPAVVPPDGFEPPINTADGPGIRREGSLVSE